MNAADEGGGRPGTHRADVVAVVVPELGLTAGEAVTLSCWLVEVGETVYEGDRLAELLIGALTFDIACPANGILRHKLLEPDDPAPPGTTLGYVAPSE